MAGIHRNAKRDKTVHKLTSSTTLTDKGNCYETREYKSAVRQLTSNANIIQNRDDLKTQER